MWMLSLLSGLFGQMTFLLLHVDHAAAFPPALTRAEEQLLLDQLAEGSEDARQKLITHNLRLVAHLTKKFYSPDREQEELISIGTLGLIKAVSTFKPEKGARFATYASRCIENEILMFYRAKKKTAGEVFFDDPLEYDKDGNALTLLDIMPDSTDLEEQVAQSMQEKQLYHYLQTKLNAREWTVIVRRYGLFGYPAQTQREVADTLQISRSYVSRIEKRALSVLREAYEQSQDAVFSYD
ncbi:MAG: RNA polymerase sporulation sigma factor SigK [Oscillospiraceae bacterium]|nr:RNA polymerase sporulation sigma factor SigK [Oscillospiraceae bacterium]